MFRSPVVIFVGIAGAGLFLVSLIAPPISGWNVTASCSGATHTLLLGQIWCWLASQKDSIGPLIQLLGVIGIVFGVLGFWRSQQLNQANAVFQMMKEARDLQLKLKPVTAGQIDNALILKMGLNFHSSIFQYRHLGFVDAVTWQPFEDDLENWLRDAGFVDWLHGRKNNLELPAACKFDPNFIEYMKSIHARIK